MAQTTSVGISYTLGRASLPNGDVAAPGSSGRRMPWWVSYRTFAMVWTALLVYGSLLPFQFHLATAYEQAGGLLPLLVAVFTSPRWVEATNPHIGIISNAKVVDLGTNLLLYGPLGICLRMDFRRMGWRIDSQIAATLLSLGAISYTLEAVQSLEASRVASLYDVVTNTAGGAAAALFGPLLKRCFEVVAFFLFRRCGALAEWFRLRIAALKQRPVALFSLVLLDIALIVAWWRTASIGRLGASGSKPFEFMYWHPYDVAAMSIGRMLIVYCLLAMVLSLQMLSLPARRRMRWVVLAVTLMAAFREFSARSGSGGSFDVTEVLVALMAVGFVVTTMHVFAHAVRRCCRRKSDQPVTVDRRRPASSAAA